MRFEKVSFGSIIIDGTAYKHDVVVDRGRVRKRKKKPSKPFRDKFGHTPLSIEEKIPWKCRRLVVGTGTGALPVMNEVKREGRRRKITLMILPTKDAIKELNQRLDETNAILHVTCKRLGSQDSRSVDMAFVATSVCRWLPSASDPLAKLFPVARER